MKRIHFLLVVLALVWAVLVCGCAGIGMSASSDSDNTTLGIFGSMQNGCRYEVTEVLNENGSHQQVWGKISCGTN
ncbi:MAG: hypothetical protein H7844_00575 [Nitrospirae bacterium YQR-1]